MKVVILHSNNYSPNEIGFLYPILRYRRTLKNIYKINLVLTSNIDEVQGDVCIASSKWFSQIWTISGSQKINHYLKTIRENVNRLIWYDISDSTGTTHFMVLPYVDRYLKNQILKDGKAYLKKYYGDRIYSDFIHKHFDIVDGNSGEAHLNYIPDECNLEKIAVGWNSGLAYYGQHRHLQNYLFGKMTSTVSLFKTKWHSPLLNKNLPLSCRIGINYSRNTITKSRQIIRRSLEHLLPTEEKLSHKAYLEELRKSRSVMSPFGLGEISLRDFEAVIYGGAIIKQDMSHLNTWPNLWLNGESYLHFAWDMSDIDEKIEFALSYPVRMTEYAVEAQNIYRTISDSEKSGRIFCERLQSLIHF